ncbi:MAG: DUF2160 family membrane protein, partial [Hyphomicrobium sp.]
RRGWLPMATTRGDRLFVGLLASAFFHLAWLGLRRHPKREAWRYTITTGVGIRKAPTSLGTIGGLKKKV